MQTDSFKTSLHQIESTLDVLLPLNNPKQETLIKAARYIVFPKGKRLRPLITLEIAKEYGAPLPSILNAASAIELLHTYTLIHDDLPCMDDETMRRGKAPLHKIVGEGLALLTGDFLLTYVFDILSNIKELNIEKRLALIQILSSLGGANGLIGGQLLDLSCDPKNLSLEELIWIYERKTADLFIACFEFASTIASIEERDRSLLKTFALKFGLTYQLLDDLEDEESDFKDQRHLSVLKILSKEETFTKVHTLIEEMQELYQSQRIKTAIQLHLLHSLKTKFTPYCPQIS